MKISLLIGSRNRPEVLARCLRHVLAQQISPLEILVLDDGSDSPQLFKVLKSQFQDSRLRFLRVDAPLGVARGRNRLMAEAGGDIFCFIDDDALLASEDSLARLVAPFQTEATMGIVAPKIIDHRPGGDDLFVPFTQRWRQRRPELVDTPGYVAYFVGTAHAIHRRVWERCGGYSDQLVYGEEELDLSYRAIEAGFRIYYLPEVVVHHYPQPPVVAAATRKQQPEYYHQTRNRFYLACRYLPWPYWPYYLAFWTIKNFFRSLKAGALPDYFAGVKDGVTLCREIERETLSPQTVAYVQANYGRLWY